MDHHATALFISHRINSGAACCSRNFATAAVLIQMHQAIPCQVHGRSNISTPRDELSPRCCVATQTGIPPVMLRNQTTQCSTKLLNQRQCTYHVLQIHERVVDGHDLHLLVPTGRPENQPPDPAEPVDAHGGLGPGGDGVRHGHFGSLYN